MFRTHLFRPSASRRVAVVSAMAVVAAANVVPQATAQTAAAEVPAIESGTFSWPIKESFISYLQMPFAHGEIIATDGAELDGTTFTFPVDAADSSLDATGNGTVAVDGALHFRAHPDGNGAYGMDVAYDDIEIEVAGTTATIVADYDVKGAMPGQEPQNISKEDQPIASFELEAPLTPEVGKTVEVTDRPTTLLAGAEESLLNYKAGTVLDDGDVDLALTFAKAEKPADPVDPTEPGEGSSSGIDLGSLTSGSADGASSSLGDEGISEQQMLAGAVAAVLAIAGLVGGAVVSGLIPGITLPELPRI